ncbi:metal-dependent transcriptional regulator [Putridiphycobacter roseus]|uniref:Transcriptional regulator MntR n=1 Tax=Putridiphycobacter roseus TaxID=2219161 RepID=A0A2W1MYH9_9FLAO|nr:metal-dependent transcriptional regulator [Putridiphycobacter roseus]PZE17239.1 metal-dependent transcriptional regulator [Putridiphycobacter roseus]
MALNLSQSEENYLKSIYRLSEIENVPVATNSIAEDVDTKASSVTEMIKRLAKKELLTYEKYKGSILTRSGISHAINIIRKHRLWETFLVDKLKFSWDEVHEIAEQLEHIQSSKLTNRLSEFLDHPDYDPHGDPIPNEKGEFPKSIQTSKLFELQEGETGTVHHIGIDSPSFLKFLTKHAIQIGSAITCIAKYDFDQSMYVKIDGEFEMSLSKKVSKNIIVK